MRTALLLLAATLVLSACRSSVPLEPVPDPGPSVTTAPAGADPTAGAAFPLTGVSTDTPKLSQPVLAVKIDNSPLARPQVGLDAADIVYEQIVEGGVTRFVALFHSQVPEEVGPVRSARLVDVPILEPWSSLLVYSGSRPEVSTALRNADQIGLLADSGRPIFRRESSRPGSHDLFVDTALALQRAPDFDETGPVPPRPYVFDAQAPDGGVSQPGFALQMTPATRTEWKWDAPAGRFRRSQNGEASKVTGDGRIGAANVVAIITDVGIGGCCDTAGNSYMTTRLTGTGEAVVWRDGQRFAATWRKTDTESQMELRTPVGTSFPLAPGPTWFHIVASSAVPAAPQ